jgi:hypothetical protein
MHSCDGSTASHGRTFDANEQDLETDSSTTTIKTRIIIHF